MGQTRNEVKRSSAQAARENRSLDEIEENIQLTRQQMSDTLHRIQRKLSMDHLGKQALDHFTDVAKDSGSTMLKQLKRYPGPTAVITFGVGWMIYQANNRGGNGSSKQQRKRRLPTENDYSLRSEDLKIGDLKGVDLDNYEEGIMSSIDEDAKDWQSRGYEKAKGFVKESKQMGQNMGEKTEELKSGLKGKAENMSGKAKDLSRQAGEKAHHAKEQVQGMSHQIKESASNFRSTMKENPVLAGVVGLAVGALAGFLIPESRRENKLMGEKKEEFMQKARERGGEAMEEVKDLAKDIGEKAADEVEQRFSSDENENGESESYSEHDAPRH